MKKFFTQILTAIGLIVALVGIVLGYKFPLEAQSSLLSLPFIAACMATAFVFAKNETVKIMGYVLSGFSGVYGVLAFLAYNASLRDANGNLLTVITPRYNPTVFAMGLIIMLVPAIIYIIIRFFSWLGFTRKSAAASSSDIATVLNQYKMLEKEQILNADEFENLKNKVLKNTGADISSLEDLKKWKKLLDQQIITEEEFTSLKAKAFNK